MKVAICALTYNRPEGIARLIRGLLSQEFRAQSAEPKIVIVDNHPGATARPVCEELARDARWPIKYVVEERPGIAFARNAALDHIGDAEWICFIDDDEVPDKHWLDELLSARHKYDADVVGGPVVPYFESTIPEWIDHGGFFQRRRHETGQRLGVAFTNNVILRRRVLDELKLRFDERWALMGCEDHAFFLTIGLAGYKMVWADEAVVTEWIPATRANAPWLVRRHYRAGNCMSFVEIAVRARWWIRPLLLARGAFWLVMGCAQLGAGLLGGRVLHLRGRRSFAYGAGMFVGLLGRPYEEYARKPLSQPCHGVRAITGDR